jgi:hypothetical protein
LSYAIVIGTDPRIYREFFLDFPKEFLIGLIGKGE